MDLCARGWRGMGKGKGGCPGVAWFKALARSLHQMEAAHGGRHCRACGQRGCNPSQLNHREPHGGLL